MIHKPQRDPFSASEDAYTFERRSGFPQAQTDAPLYYEEEKEKWWGIFLNPVGVIFLAGVVAALLAGAWFVLSPSTYSKHRTSKEIPVIKVEDVEYKKLPEDEGGVKVDHQDKEVYKRMADDMSSVEPVAIKSEEKPVEIEDAESAPTSKEDHNSNKSSTAAILGNKAEELETAKEETKDQKKESAKVEENLVQPDVVIEASKPKAIDHAKALAQQTNKVEKKAASGLSSGKFVINVASFRKENTAQKELKRVLETFPMLLKGVGHEVRVLTTKTNGEFFVPMIGAFKTLEAAKKVVKALEAKNFSVSIARAPS